jgi:hypothetical protein
VTAPTFTFTVLTPEYEVVHLTTYGSLVAGYAEASGRGSIRSVYTHAPQEGLVTFSDGSRYDDRAVAWDKA